MSNKDEKILIISDLHLTTNFIKKKYEYLEKLFSSVDKIIINGDFWTAYYNSFDEFVKSKWNGLFPLLKSKNAVYVCGNHDKKRWMDDRFGLFSNYQGESYKFVSGGKSFLCIHGQQYLGDSISTDNYLKYWSLFKVDFFKYMIESLMLRLFGRKLYKPATILNNKVKKITSEMKNVDYVVIGHTHWGEIDKKHKFINSGIIHSGVSNYILIVNGKPQLITESY